MTTDELQRRMAELPTEKLESIVSARPGDYTSEAVAAAQSELAGRPAERVYQELAASPQSASSIGQSVRSLAALVIVWIAWVCVLGTARTLLAFNGLVAPLMFSCVAGGCFWVAYRLSSAWRRLVVVVPLFFGALFLIRAVFSSAREEFAFNAFVFLLGGAATAVALRLRSQRKNAKTPAG